MVEEIAVALDFETADNRPDSACALGMARIRAGAVEDIFYSLIRPPRSRVYFTHIHGLTWSMLRDAPSFAELWPHVEDFMMGAEYFLAHNASFDRGILYGCCAAAGLSPPDIPFLCTVKGSRKSLGLRHNRLSDVCTHLDIELQHHHAGSDALASARIYLHLRHGGLAPEAMALKSRHFS